MPDTNHTLMDTHNAHAEPQPPVLGKDKTIGDLIHDMPAHWRAIAMLNPYINDTIRAVETSCQHKEGLMLHHSCGVDDTAFRLFYVRDTLYVLSNQGDEAAIGPIPVAETVPDVDMFSKHDMRHQGFAPLLNKPCSFYLGWTPNTNGYEHAPPPEKQMDVCNWVWWNNEENHPQRWFFNNADNSYAIPYLGRFALATFTEFENEADVSDLRDLKAFCDNNAQPAPDALIQALTEAKTTQEFHQAIEQNLDRRFYRAKKRGMAGELIQGLGPAAKSATEPKWENRLRMTGFTYQTARHPKNHPDLTGDPAMPLRVFYDWPESDKDGKMPHMLTRLSLDQHRWCDTAYMDIHLDLYGNETFVMEPDDSCFDLGRGKRGIVKQNWAQFDGGVSKATITDNPVICPGKTLNVTALKSDGDRWFWVWYTPDNQGQLFMEVPQKADVILVLTDYYSYDMNPNPFPPDWDKLPTHCAKPPSS